MLGKNLFKIVFLFLLILQLSNPLSAIRLCSSNLCSPNLEEIEKQEQEKQDALKKFQPDFYIKDQLPEDLVILEDMKSESNNLFFEIGQDTKDALFEVSRIECSPKRDVYIRAIKNYSAKEVILYTQDNFRIASLFFKRENAPINIIYVTGYFNDQTPTKEWPCPFATLFKNFNILSFDWRGFGDSEGDKGKLSSSFGTNAYLDIQAAIDFVKKDNDKPIVLVGFCAGAAMSLNATFIAQQNGQNTADALVLNSMFSKFENQFNRAVNAEDRFFRKMAMQSGLAKFYLDYTLNGSLFDLKPIEIIDQIKIPCYFEHYTDDPFAIVQEGIEVFEKTKTFKMFMRSDKGKHVRMHSVVPYQYKNAFYDFLQKSGLLPTELINSYKEKDIYDIAQTILTKQTK